MSQSPSALETIFNEELYQVQGPVLVVLPCAWNELSEGEQTTLSKMLTAVKLSLSSVQIITRKTFTLAELSTFSPTKVLAFGSTCSSADKKYQALQLDSLQLILSDSLKTLDDAQKKELWQALKKMFAL